MAHQWLLFFQSDHFSETQQALMMKTVTLCFCFSSDSIKSLIVLVKANDGHDEAKPMQLIVSVFCFSKAEWATERGGGGTEIVTSWEVSVLTVEKKGSYLGCGECSDTQRISRSVFHKAKALSGHLQVFLTFPLTLCFFLSLFPYSIATLPGGERNRPWSVGREEEEEVWTGWT